MTGGEKMKLFLYGRVKQIAKNIKRNQKTKEEKSITSWHEELLRSYMWPLG
jgi:hypothetical protein